MKEVVKGFRDYTEDDALKRAKIKRILVDTFEKYGFNSVETPIVEYEEFVKGDNERDEAVSDIFKLKDKGKRDLALRYEFTFQLKRISQNKKLPYKVYQIGPVFRDEPVSANRFRQFTQCDIDVVGSTIKNDAEMLAIAREVLDSLKIKAVIYVNNRELLNEILEVEGITKNKEQVLREIDKFDKLTEKELRENLKKFDAEKIVRILKKPEDYFEKYKSYENIRELKKSCRDYGFRIEFLPSLVRGLSYYNGNVFEIKTKEMKESICAGGSYPVNNVQSVGISFGLDRLSSLTKVKDMRNKILIISLKEDKKAIELAKRLREQGNLVSIFYGKPSKALDYANSYGIGQVIFVGAQEVKKKVFKVKDMVTGREKTLVLEKRTKKNLVLKRK
jgi:histidyl-tRNA synthetase